MPVVVDFWHDGCIWCKRLDPYYEQLSKEYIGAKFTKLDIYASDQNSEIAEKYGIMGTPTMKVFCNGREIGEIVGYMDKDGIKRNLDQIIKRSDECLRNSTPVNKA